MTVGPGRGAHERSLAAKLVPHQNSKSLDGLPVCRPGRLRQLQSQESADVDKLNRWLTLAANLGVLAGLILVSLQIRQNTGAQQSSAIQTVISDYRERQLQPVD